MFDLVRRTTTVWISWLKMSIVAEPELQLHESLTVKNIEDVPLSGIKNVYRKDFYKFLLFLKLFFRESPLLMHRMVTKYKLIRRRKKMPLIDWFVLKLWTFTSNLCSCILFLNQKLSHLLYLEKLDPLYKKNQPNYVLINWLKNIPKNKSHIISPSIVAMKPPTIINMNLRFINLFSLR